jgi:hypothetical protein
MTSSEVAFRSISVGRCTGISNSGSTAGHRLKAGADRVQKSLSWQPTFVHRDRGSRTVPIAIAKTQVNVSVEVMGLCSNPSWSAELG